jgi:hypothetical protein
MMTRLFVRVDCDFESDGLWDERGRMYDLESMPLSAPLKQHIRDWQRRFSAEAQPWLPDDKFDWEANKREGEVIARKVKAELPDWEVVADDRLILEDGSLGERVPYPGEDSPVV